MTDKTPDISYIKVLHRVRSRKVGGTRETTHALKCFAKDRSDNGAKLAKTRAYARCVMISQIMEE